MSNPKYTNIKVKLTGQNGNTLSLMGVVTKAMRKAGCTEDEIAAYRREALSGDYNNFLRVSMATVAVS